MVICSAVFAVEPSLAVDTPWAPMKRRAPATNPMKVIVNFFMTNSSGYLIRFLAIYSDIITAMSFYPNYLIIQCLIIQIYAWVLGIKFQSFGDSYHFSILARFRTVFMS